MGQYWYFLTNKFNINLQKHMTYKQEKTKLQTGRYYFMMNLSIIFRNVVEVINVF